MVEQSSEADFFETLESLRRSYLVISKQQGMAPQQLTCVYQWISALKSIECNKSYKKVCLRNQMAIDLLQQLQFQRKLEWPFD